MKSLSPNTGINMPLNTSSWHRTSFIVLLAIRVLEMSNDVKLV